MPPGSSFAPTITDLQQFNDVHTNYNRPLATVTIKLPSFMQHDIKMYT